MEQQPVKISWVNQAYQRLPWIRALYGRRVAPPNEQRSNTTLANDLVLQRRAEPVAQREELKEKITKE